MTSSSPGLPDRDPEVGDTIEPVSFDVSETRIEAYFQGLDMAPAESASDSAFDQAVAPSMLVGTAEDLVIRRLFLRNVFGNLWIRQQWSFRAPLHLGERYQIDGEVRDIYDYRGRSVVLAEVNIENAAGAIAATGRHHQSFLVEQSTGSVDLRSPQKKEGRRRYLRPEGEAIEGLARTISLEMCGLFFHGKANYHTSRSSAEELGFSDVVVGGRMTLSLVTEMLQRHFGASWWQGGEIDVKFTNIVWPGDRISANGVLTAAGESPAGRAQAAVWVEKDDGTVVLVGSATAPSQPN